MLPGTRALVAITFHDSELGGATRSVLRAIPELERLGWSFAFYVDGPGPASRWLTERGYDVVVRRRAVGFTREWLRRPPDGPRKLRSVLPWLAGWGGFLRSRRPALVHANTALTLVEALLARGLRIPTVLHVHEMFPRDDWKAGVARRVIAATGVVPVAVSQASVAALAGGVLLPTLVYESTTVPGQAPARPANRTPLVVGSMGAIDTRKGTDVFVRAARQILARRPDVEIRLVGDYDERFNDGDWARRVLADAAAAGVRHVQHADTFSELAGWDVAVLASRSDPFPLVVLEAMAAGLPVVGTRTDGIAEQVTAETGLLADSEDADALARHVLTLLDDPDRRSSMGRAGRERVAANFTEVHQAQGLDAVYRAAAGPTCSVLAPE